MTMPARRMPFIVGCGRSGTTLLAAMLDSHSRVAIPGESGFVIDLCSLPTTPGITVAEVFTEAIRRLDRFQAWGIDAETLRAHLTARGPVTMRDAMRLTYGLFAATHGKDIPGDKTPDHVLVLPRLAGLFPEAVFIHLIRDGRDVALSTLDAAWGPDTVESAALYWRRRVRAGRRAGRRLGEHRYMELHYEALVDDTERQLRRISSFLDIGYEPRMLEHSAAALRQLSMSPDPSADRSLGLPATPGLRNWREQMKPLDVATFGALAGLTLRACGYAPGPTITGRQRMIVLRRVVGHVLSAPVHGVLRRVAAARTRRRGSSA